MCEMDDSLLQCQTAWFAVWDLCKELGMETNSNNSGCEDVLNFISNMNNQLMIAKDELE